MMLTDLVVAGQVGEKTLSLMRDAASQGMAATWAPGVRTAGGHSHRGNHEPGLASHSKELSTVI